MGISLSIVFFSSKKRFCYSTSFSFPNKCWNLLDILYHVIYWIYRSMSKDMKTIFLSNLQTWFDTLFYLNLFSQWCFIFMKIIIHIFCKFFPKNRHIFGDTVGLVSDHHKTANIAVKRVTPMFCFPSACNGHVYTLLNSIQCAVHCSSVQPLSRV